MSAAEIGGIVAVSLVFGVAGIALIRNFDLNWDNPEPSSSHNRSRSSSSSHNSSHNSSRTNSSEREREKDAQDIAYLKDKNYNIEGQGKSRRRYTKKSSRKNKKH